MINTDYTIPKDWKGNLIQPGDVIFPVATKPFFSGGRIVLMDFSTNDRSKDKTLHEWKALEHVWYPGQKYKVIDAGEGALRFETLNSDITVNVCWYFMQFGMQTDTIFCIEGKSDNEQEYYTEYFKA